MYRKDYIINWITCKVGKYGTYSIDSLSKASKNLGPKVKTVVGVMGDLMFFMIILTPFMFGFGIACQSIMYTNEWRFDEVFFGTFVKEMVGKSFHLNLFFN